MCNTRKQPKKTQNNLHFATQQAPYWVSKQKVKAKNKKNTQNSLPIDKIAVTLPTDGKMPTQKYQLI